MSNIISFFQKLIKGGVGIRAGGWKIFQKLISGGTIIQYSRVVGNVITNLPCCNFFHGILKKLPKLKTSSKQKKHLHEKNDTNHTNHKICTS